jgi:peptide methionine sulfoxide reductase msrA/msrB
MSCKLIFLYTTALLSLNSCSQNTNTMQYNKLTPEEERVIIHKGTEAPFSGKYEKFEGKGTYVCKRCNAPLYKSSDKFDAQCGWPAFDDEISGAVKRYPDTDGQRTEIVCTKCGAHLGHVFNGEGFTPKNTRHCVNSISLSFIPAEKESVKTEKAIFAGGCFWGVEYFFQHAKGVISTRVGYIGGHTKNPTYKEVCTHTTGHAEAMEVTFDPTKTSFEELARLFFEIHDPTQVNRQGPDIGDQYRSEIFYINDAQKEITLKLIKLLEQKGYSITTKVTKATEFYEAENYHQQYYEHKGSTPYCHGYVKRF